MGPPSADPQRDWRRPRDTHSGGLTQFCPSEGPAFSVSEGLAEQGPGRLFFAPSRSHRCVGRGQRRCAARVAGSGVPGSERGGQKRRRVQVSRRKKMPGEAEAARLPPRDGGGKRRPPGARVPASTVGRRRRQSRRQRRRRRQLHISSSSGSSPNPEPVRAASAGSRVGKRQAQQASVGRQRRHAAPHGAGGRRRRL